MYILDGAKGPKSLRASSSLVVQGGKIKRKFVDLGAPLRRNSNKGKKWKEKEKEANRFSPGGRIFRGRLGHWKPKPPSAAQASPRSPCMPFSWFNDSRKGCYSFTNLPSSTSPLQPSPETLISDKKGSKTGEYATDEEEDEVGPILPGSDMAIEVFELPENEDMFSPSDLDTSKLSHKFKELQIKHAVTEAEIQKLKTKLQAAENEKVRWELEKTQLQQNIEENKERMLKLESYWIEAQTLCHTVNEHLKETQSQYQALEKKYNKAKKLIKDFQQKELDFIKRQEAERKKIEDLEKAHLVEVQGLQVRIRDLEAEVFRLLKQNGTQVNNNNNIFERRTSLGEVSKGDTLENLDVKQTSCQDRLSQDLNEAIPETERLDSKALKTRAQLSVKNRRQRPSRTRLYDSVSSTDGEDSLERKVSTLDHFLTYCVGLCPCSYSL